MDLYYKLAITVLLDIVAMGKSANRFYPALAKVYVAIHRLAQVDSFLAAEIEHQENKKGGV